MLYSSRWALTAWHAVDPKNAASKYKDLRIRFGTQTSGIRLGAIFKHPVLDIALVPLTTPYSGVSPTWRLPLSQGSTPVIVATHATTKINCFGFGPHTITTTGGDIVHGDPFQLWPAIPGCSIAQCNTGPDEFATEGTAVLYWNNPTNHDAGTHVVNTNGVAIAEGDSGGGCFDPSTSELLGITRGNVLYDPTKTGSSVSTSLSQASVTGRPISWTDWRPRSWT